MPAQPNRRRAIWFTTIVWIGDSITANGVGPIASPSEMGYQSVVQGHMANRIHALTACGGLATRNYLPEARSTLYPCANGDGERIHLWTALVRPHLGPHTLAVVNLGTNDAALRRRGRLTLTHFYKNVDRLTRAILYWGASIQLVLPPRTLDVARAPLIEEQNAMLLEHICNGIDSSKALEPAPEPDASGRPEPAVRCLDLTHLLDSSQYHEDDPIHPSVRGHALMAESVFHAILRWQ